MPLEEGERFSSQLSKVEFRKIKILGSRIKSLLALWSTCEVSQA